MKVNVTRKHLNAMVDGKLALIPVGEQDLKDELAKRLVKSGFAEEVTTKTTAKK